MGREAESDGSLEEKQREGRKRRATW